MVGRAAGAPAGEGNLRGGAARVNSGRVAGGAAEAGGRRRRGGRAPLLTGRGGAIRFELGVDQSGHQLGAFDQAGARAADERILDREDAPIPFIVYGPLSPDVVENVRLYV